MVRQRPPSAAADPRTDLLRHQLGRLDAWTARDLRYRLDEALQGSPSTPRNRPIVSGKRSDPDQALATLLQIGAKLGLWDDKTEY